MTASAEFFPDQYSDTSSCHIDDKIIDIGNADAENTLRKFDQYNQTENHEKSLTKVPEIREQHRQKCPHRHQQNKISADIAERKSQTYKISFRYQMVDITCDRFKRTNVGICAEIFHPGDIKRCRP